VSNEVTREEARKLLASFGDEGRVIEWLRLREEFYSFQPFRWLSLPGLQSLRFPTFREQPTPNQRLRKTKEYQ
jgi:hypothetical protein